MGLWQDFVGFVTLKPLELSEAWQALDETKLKTDKKAPVNLTGMRFVPDREIARKYVSAEFMQNKITEVTECLFYHCSNNFHEISSFNPLFDEESRPYGEVTIYWNSKDSGRRPGLTLKLSEELDESFEVSLHRALSVILAPLRSKPDVGFSLRYQVNSAHPKWKKPKHLKHLTF